MAKKKIPEVRLLLDGETLFDMDREPDDQEVLVKVQLKEKELYIYGISHGEVIAEESRDYNSLGLVVLSKRKHMAMLRFIEECHGSAREHLEGSDTDTSTILEAIHNRAAKLLGKEPW